MRKNMIKFLALLLVAILPLALSACGGGGGGSSSSSSSSSSSGTTSSSSSSSGTTSSSSSSSGATSSSSSSSGTVLEATTPLTVATQVSVVDPHLSGSVAGAKPLAVAWYNVRSWFRSAPTGTVDYNMDKTQVYVQEQSTESFNTINMILCMMGQTKYDTMLNQGNYLALVDNNVCNSSKSDASSAGQQTQNQASSTNMPDYYKFTTLSSRASNTADEIVNIWMHQPANDGGGQSPEMLIYINIVISEGTSSVNPYGIFTMNFAGYPVMNGTPVSTMAMHGTLKAVRANPADLTSKVLLQFVEADQKGGGGGGGGSETSQQKVTLDRQPDGSAGAGHVFQSHVSTMGSGTIDLDIAFNSSDFFRHDVVTGSSFCLSRTLFDESAWSYSLYDTTGTRVTRNSGFPITFTKSGVLHQGFVGYWGVWTDGTTTLSNNDTVQKMDYNGGNTTTTPYTVFIAGGKLHKHVKQTLTLGNIKNVPIQYNEWSGSTGTNYQVVWDGTNLNKVAYMPQMCSGNCTWTNITSTPTPTVDVTHITNGGGSINFWSDSLGGSGQIVLSNCTYTSQPMQPGYTTCDVPASSDPVIFYTDAVVYPGDTVPGSFTCYDNCPTIDPSTGQATMNMMSAPSITPTATSYTFSATTGANGMTLMLGTDPVLMTMLTQTQQYGIQSGPMFDPSTTAMSLFDCNWDGDNDPTTQPQICSWKAWNVLPVFYTWETGPDNWNQFVGVKDSNGTFVKFDTPLMVKYVGTGDPYGTLGATFMLQYGGYGQLQGIPGKCVDMNTGADADCSLSNSSSSIRYVPQFTIPTLTGGSPTTVLDAADNTTQYYVKPLQVEQRMKADPSACTTLATTDFTAYTLPDISIWSDPTTANGVEPTVTAAPAVIGGVVQ